ncbi:MAG TPA: GNAT family protein [Candidatus Hydromicrobium sp.]
MSGKKILNNYPVRKISGKKTTLRVLEKKDLRRSLVWLKDPSVNMYLSHSFRDYTEEQELKWFEFVQNSNNDVVFAIEDIDTHLYIGNCALHKIDWEKESCEMGIVIGEKNYWNKGYGSDAIKNIINFALFNLNLKSIKLDVYRYNRRAITVYRKCGFKLVQIEKRSHFYNGKYWDTLLMEFKKPEFNRLYSFYILIFN